MLHSLLSFSHDKCSPRRFLQLFQNILFEEREREKGEILNYIFLVYTLSRLSSGNSRRWGLPLNSLPGNWKDAIKVQDHGYTTMFDCVSQPDIEINRLTLLYRNLHVDI